MGVTAFKVTIYDHRRLLYQGPASRVRLPGEAGECEVMAFHADMIALLRPGLVVVDDQALPVNRGVAKMDRNELLVLIER